MSKKFSKRDNQLAALELELSTILTRELNKRPHVGLKLLFASVPVQNLINPVINKIEVISGSSVHIVYNSYRDKETGKRSVFVNIKD